MAEALLVSLRSVKSPVLTSAALDILERSVGAVGITNAQRGVHVESVLMACLLEACGIAGGAVTVDQLIHRWTGQTLDQLAGERKARLRNAPKLLLTRVAAAPFVCSSAESVDGDDDRILDAFRGRCTGQMLRLPNAAGPEFMLGLVAPPESAGKGKEAAAATEALPIVLSLGAKNLRLRNRSELSKNDTTGYAGNLFDNRAKGSAKRKAALEQVMTLTSGKKNDPGRRREVFNIQISADIVGEPLALALFACCCLLLPLCCSSIIDHLAARVAVGGASDGKTTIEAMEQVCSCCLWVDP